MEIVISLIYLEDRRSSSLPLIQGERAQVYLAIVIIKETIRRDVHVEEAWNLLWHFNGKIEVS